jgi:hypothetical protein
MILHVFETCYSTYKQLTLHYAAGTSGLAVDAQQPGKTTPSETASPDEYGGQAAQEGEVEVVASPNEEEEAVAGSRLPDCEHACGPCAPCKRVMVSFRCVDAAESCPIAYRCMCRGRFFRVPTL